MCAVIAYTELTKPGSESEFLELKHQSSEQFKKEYSVAQVKLKRKVSPTHKTTSLKIYS